MRFTLLVVALFSLTACAATVTGQGTRASGAGSSSSTVRTPEAEPFTLRGVLELTDSFAPAAGKGGDPCGGVGGFDDLTVGAQVDVSDAGSTTVATGSVISGTLNFAGAASCILTFTADDVPSGEGFYGVTIGHRDPLKVAEADAKSGTLSFTIG